MADALGRERASESVASRFTRIMNATTSPLGVLSDPPIIAFATAPLFIAFLAALRLDVGATIVQALGALAALPIVVGILVSLALFGARGRVIAWLAALPFAVENVNALLNGLGEGLEITFASACPTTAELNQALDQVSPDAFVTAALATQSGSDASGGASAEGRVIEVRIGVVDSKRNPAGSNHRRYLRVLSIVDQVLVPLHARCPITEVRVK